MFISPSSKSLALAALLLLSSTVHPASAVESRADVRIEIDNDLFTTTHRDRDYTGGVAVTWSGEAVRQGMLSLQPVLERIDNLGNTAGADENEQTVPLASPFKRYARQVGAIAFTPGDLKSHQALQNDRPYASLLYVANGMTTVSGDETSAKIQTLTVGILGLPAFAAGHRAIHRATGSVPPEGYSHQISAGGEPTARYLIAQQQLWYENPNATLQIKGSAAGSAGYLTEANAAVSIRVGHFATPWWSSTSELADYIAAPAPFERVPEWTAQLYMTGGVRVTARAYNVFLQGQFRDSDVRYSSSEVRPVLADAWISLHWQSIYGTELSYALHYQSGELRRGPAAQSLVWGAVQINRYF